MEADPLHGRPVHGAITIRTERINATVGPRPLPDSHAGLVLTHRPLRPVANDLGPEAARDSCHSELKKGATMIVVCLCEKERAGSRRREEWMRIERRREEAANADPCRREVARGAIHRRKATIGVSLPKRVRRNGPS